jgi:hypothetical protein
MDEWKKNSTPLPGDAAAHAPHNREKDSTETNNNIDSIKIRTSSTSNKSSRKHLAIMNSMRKRVTAAKHSTSRDMTKQEMRMRRMNQHLVEQHYKIDQENHVLLPGVPAYDEDLARDFHDFFNLICLVSRYMNVVFSMYTMCVCVCVSVCLCVPETE